MEGGEGKEVKVGLESSSKELTVPYVTAIRQEAKEKIPAHERTIDIVFDEINK